MIDWDSVDLVVFDVDGTLYDQKKLRCLMAFELVAETWNKKSFEAITVLKKYREIREQMGEEETFNFEPKLVSAVASAFRISETTVNKVVAEWILKRPLRYLKRCRFDGVPELFENLRLAGKSIGILSDYPADAKLDALGISADFIVFAGQDAVRMLKPSPIGLATVISLAKSSEERTLMIGDRVEKDGYAARKIGVRALIKSKRKTADWETFRDYHASEFNNLSEIIKWKR